MSTFEQHWGTRYTSTGRSHITDYGTDEARARGDYHPRDNRA